MEIIDGRGLEIEALVEFLRILVLGVNEYRAAADNVGRLSGAFQRVLHEAFTYPFPLLMEIHRQPR